MWDELENALAWFKSAPAGWIDSGKQNLASAAEWIWVVIQGDFAEEQSTGQVATGTVISMIPFVDQLCDVRDVVANCRKINSDASDKWAWVALVLTLIGLFPVLGSLAKGCCKILFAYGRKSVFRVGKAALDAGFWKASKPYVEAGIQTLNKHLQSPAVRRAMRAIKVVNPYHWIAAKVREVNGKLAVAELVRAFDKVLEALRYFVDLIQRWGTAAMATRAGELLKSVTHVREMMNQRLGEVLAPVNQWLKKLERRLEIEGDMLYRADVDAVNPHKYQWLTQDDEAALLTDHGAKWVDKAKRGLPYESLDEFKPVANWPNLEPKLKPNEKHPLKDAYQTFHSAQHVTIPPGEVLYRIVDPSSADNSICWMRKEEFLKLKSRDDWRRRFAVWRHWNRNGEYVTYTVPPGAGLNVWEGPAASQRLDRHPEYVLEGGANQIVLDPTHLQPEHLGKRQPTNWGYTDFPGETDEFLGLPKLTNNLNPKNLPPNDTMRGTQ
ncbi:hypothetical protein [Ralstonia pseudosolanacearum]|uniref:hypothetical protein n=1 Tax=Ralstonia pseudosolanacearum TaxID=1310165 RepID=UPI000490763E|nr:hypothetical protein [Ralstonia pseudosolanacearum]MDO3555561.1 hypothetical protein [Ralstonia pseudosolanacearum]MDO3563777.1 hypothetical protein [Ralstonia pseudosolanacearum]MDO3573456.1 hypothetical protein [Ralstonia pseudosolanacearum]MDO3575254.1 hypothetical protein [Ralstonia pseudosolanacearum]MDO3585065.1 hypothetical protein [Ralstonia pseudosolanacearum]